MMRKTSVIPVGMTLVGEVEGDADLVVFGRVEGPIHVGGSLVIEVGAVVRGHVRGRSVTVRGVLKGDAFGDELVRVDESARLVGELTAPRVQVTPGAHFRGQIHVGQVGEPHLSSYDPRLHTVSGWPAPETSTSPGTTWAGTTSVGAPSPGTPSPGASSPGATSPGASSPGTPSSGTSSSGTSSSGTPSPGTPSSGATSSSATSSAPRPVGGHRWLERHEDRGDPPRVMSAREPDHAATGHLAQGGTEQGGAALEVLNEEPFDADATLSEATPFSPPPERLPLGMPRLGRTPGTRRWS